MFRALGDRRLFATGGPSVEILYLLISSEGFRHKHNENPQESIEGALAFHKPL